MTVRAWAGPATGGVQVWAFTPADDQATICVALAGPGPRLRLDTRSTQRWMYKFRLNPAVPQVRLWNTADLHRRTNDPTDHIFASTRPGSVAETLRRRHPWQGTDAHRDDQVRRVELWRHLTGDPAHDVDHYLTRLDRPLGGDRG